MTRSVVGGLAVLREMEKLRTDASDRPTKPLTLVKTIVLANPFDLADRLLAEDTSRFKVVDFHAESTAEKQALGWYLDGRVSAVFGTHTHVPTADARVLPGGTGYLTDVGMTGPVDSVIGVRPELAVRKQRTHRPVRFEVAQGPCRLDAVLFTCDDATGRCLSAQPVRETEEPQGKAHA